MDANQVTGILRAEKKIRAVATRTITMGMLATTTGSAGVTINGVSPLEENIVSMLNKKIIDGDELDPQRKNQILLGKKLADKMKLKAGSKLVLTFTDREGNITSGAFRIAGIYATSNTPMDEQNVFVMRQTLNAYLGLAPADCHEIAIILFQDEDVEGTKQELKQKVSGYKVETWRENSPETDLMVGTIDNYSAIIIIIIMIALAFGVINTMLMSVLERKREIGMLTALGMNRFRVFLLILTETVILTLVGVPAGLLTSWFTIEFFSSTGIDISSFSEAAMSGFGFSSMIYPEFPFESLTMVMTIVVGTAIISSIFPSLKAIRLQPADALRQ
jgi:ABC-type lipoprotein release transport system permease subunit